MTPPIRMASVPPNVLESIAFNLCSLHDFDPAFVQQNERFALAAITEYLRAQPSADPARAGAVTRWAQDSINKLCSRGATLTAAPVREEGGAVDRVMAVLNYWFDGTRRIDRNSEMVRQLAALATRSDDKPEGVAVSVAARALLDACIADFGDPKDFPDDDGWVASGDKGDSAVTFKHMRDLQSALATREEAQAEAGEELAGAMRRLADDAENEAGLGAGILGGARIAADIRTVLAALRAQPQARSGEGQ